MKKILIKLLALTIIMIATAIVSSSIVCAKEILDRGSCGKNATYTIYDDGALVIKGKGEIYNAWSDRDSYGYDYDRDDEAGAGYASSGYDYDCEYYINSVSIGKGITEIGDSTFESHYYVETVKLPSTLKKIGKYAFMNCEEIKSINIPNSVKYIDNEAFCMCLSLKNVKFSNGLVSIGEDAFFSCGLSGSLILPSSLTSLGSDAFEMCTGLTDITVPGSIKVIPWGAFAYHEFFDERKKLKSVTIEEGVKKIEQEAFACITSLEKITIPRSVKYIGPYAFDCCDYDKLTIHGYSGSYAETYADEEGLKFKAIDKSSGSKNKWDKRFSNPGAKKYNAELAKFCANLCNENDKEKRDDKSGSSWDSIKDELDKQGFQNREYNYGKGENNAHTIASKEDVSVGGKKYNILVIICRGTKTSYETIGHADMFEPKEFWGFKAKTNVYDSYTSAMTDLENYIDDDEHSYLKEGNLKIIVTGHSLGGAAANLLAANFINIAENPKSNYWTSSITTKNDIYAYTFGAIDSLKKDVTTEEQEDEAKSYYYRNIHNVYNIHDTFHNDRPDGKNGWTQSTTKYKFGEMHKFAYKFSPKKFLDPLKLIADPFEVPDHAMYNYKKAVDKGYLETYKVK